MRVDARHKLARPLEPSDAAENDPIAKNPALGRWATQMLVSIITNIPGDRET